MTATPRPGTVRSGAGIVNVDLAGTAVFAAAAVAGVARPDPLAVVTAVVSCMLFAAGCGVFLWAYGVAVGRSRTDAIGIGGLFFLAGDTAPRHVRARLMVNLAGQVVIALTAAALRPFTPVAFGILAPMFGLGMAGLWSARYGDFPSRETTGREPTGREPTGRAERAPDVGRGGRGEGQR